MERIVIEVSPNVARAWRSMPEAQKKELGNEVSVRIARKYFKDSQAGFLHLLMICKRMAARGLTQEKLDETLSEEA